MIGPPGEVPARGDVARLLEDAPLPWPWVRLYADDRRRFRFVCRRCGTVERVRHRAVEEVRRAGQRFLLRHVGCRAVPWYVRWWRRVLRG